MANERQGTEAGQPGTNKRQEAGEQALEPSRNAVQWHFFTPYFREKLLAADLLSPGAKLCM